MKVRISESTGRVLDWLVAVAVEGVKPDIFEGLPVLGLHDHDGVLTYLDSCDYSSDIAKTSALMDRDIDMLLGRGQPGGADIGDTDPEHRFTAVISRGGDAPVKAFGGTMALACLRCIAMKHHGQEAEVPDRLLNES